MPLRKQLGKYVAVLILTGVYPMLVATNEQYSRRNVDMATKIRREANRLRSNLPDYDLECVYTGPK